jgi:hypothetical protein
MNKTQEKKEEEEQEKEKKEEEEEEEKEWTFVTSTRKKRADQKIKRQNKSVIANRYLTPVCFSTKCSPNTIIRNAIDGSYFKHYQDMTVGKWSNHFFRVTMSVGPRNDDKHHYYYETIGEYMDHQLISYLPENKAQMSRITDKWYAKINELKDISETKSKKMDNNDICQYNFQRIPWTDIPCSIKI